MSEVSRWICLPRGETAELCRSALRAAGADRRAADLVTDAALYAEDRGRSVVGVAHVLDHVEALDDGRLDGAATPRLTRPMPAVVAGDAADGVAHVGFVDALPELLGIARRLGVAVFTCSGSFTCGPLGWFTERLADAGFVALAAATSPAVMAAGPGTPAVFGTNPFAAAVPRAGGPPLAFDQASSATAFVSVREAAERGEDLMQGWALDEYGAPTTDPVAALAGALLPFGGYKGANVALLVELLAAFAGGAWSLDAAPWDSGCVPPRTGMFVLAVDPAGLSPGFAERVGEFADRLTAAGVRLPGGAATPAAELRIRGDVVAALRRRAERGARR